MSDRTSVRSPVASSHHCLTTIAGMLEGSSPPSLHSPYCCYTPRLVVASDITWCYLSAPSQPVRSARPRRRRVAGACVRVQRALREAIRQLLAEVPRTGLSGNAPPSGNGPKWERAGV
jgi:hypothetical protein